MHHWFIERMATESLHPNPHDGDGYITKAEMARRLNRTGRTVEKWMRAGRLPYLKIGRSILFHWPTVENYLKERYQVLPAVTRLKPHERIMLAHRAAVRHDSAGSQRSA